MASSADRDIIPVSRDLWTLESYRRTVGTTHPALAGREPASELLTLLLSTLQQRRTVYLAQVERGVRRFGGAAVATGISVSFAVGGACPAVGQRPPAGRYGDYS